MWCVFLQVIRAAIFGVGAPEALLVGVVALVVFGPKGLAQVLPSLILKKIERLKGNLMQRELHRICRALYTCLSREFCGAMYVWICLDTSLRSGVFFWLLLREG